MTGEQEEEKTWREGDKDIVVSLLYIKIIIIYTTVINISTLILTTMHGSCITYCLCV